MKGLITCWTTKQSAKPAALTIYHPADGMDIFLNFFTVSWKWKFEKLKFYDDNLLIIPGEIMLLQIEIIHKWSHHLINN